MKRNEEGKGKLASSKAVAALTAAILACTVVFAIGPASGLLGDMQDDSPESSLSTEGHLSIYGTEKGSSGYGGAGKASTSSGDSGSSTSKVAESTAANSEGFVSLDQIPEYSGSPCVELNGNVPYFNAADYPDESFESYAPLDNLGRCGECAALVGEETMPTEKRGSIGQVKPSGWVMHKYDWVDGKYVYNRCHLLGYQLTAENANVRNLITGTRSMNVDGMEPYESKVAQYVKSTGNHVLYRVTPLFEGDELVARGVVMEAQSVEDDGAGISFCIYCYNVEPGVAIDYATGENWADGSMGSGESSDSSSASSQSAGSAAAGAAAASGSSASSGDQVSASYVLNTNTRKFHYPSCSSVSRMSDANKQYFEGSREEVIAQGYEPCKRCNP